MKTQTTINIENLIPSSLLEEENSDNESIPNLEFEDNSPLCKKDSQEKKSDNVIHNIYNNHPYRLKIIQIQEKLMLMKKQNPNRIKVKAKIFILNYKSLRKKKLH